MSWQLVVLIVTSPFWIAAAILALSFIVIVAVALLVMIIAGCFIAWFGAEPNRRSGQATNSRETAFA